MKFHSAVAMYKIKNAVVLCKLDTIKNYEKTSIYAHFDNFCPIIPYSSILRTIPVAFIYTFLLKLQIVLLLSVTYEEIYRIDLLLKINMI